MKVALGVALVCGFFLLANSVHAAIVGGTVTKIDPPANTGQDNQQVNALLGFDELQHVLLTSDLVIDAPAGVIPAGTVVSSHYVIYDPAGSSSITGTVVVDQHVVGLIYMTDTLNDSDYLGVPVTNYLNPTMRGFEAGDTATIIDPNTVSFSLSASSPGDYARIITASDQAVPGPQFVMRSPRAAPGGVHTNQDGVGTVRLLFDQPLVFQSSDVTVIDEDGQSVVCYATGSGSPFMIVTFAEVLFADRYTVTVHDSVASILNGAPIDGDNDGNAGGDYVFVMEHRKRADGDNDNDVDLVDLALLAREWLWSTP
ncbi:MAG: hypothetical protein JW810_07835 [Sedimentisphaerales bacterium]|nr:hypothetical protein [Sedimentisphaerales bacterium]